MANNVILTDAEVLVRNERRRQVEKGYTSEVDDSRTQEEMRRVIRAKVNAMVELDTAIVNRERTDGAVVEDFVLYWTQVAAVAQAAIESIARTNVVMVGQTGDAP